MISLVRSLSETKYITQEAFHRDIWSSLNGKDWTQIVPQEPYWEQHAVRRLETRSEVRQPQESPNVDGFSGASSFPPLP